MPTGSSNAEIIKLLHCRVTFRIMANLPFDFGARSVEALGNLPNGIRLLVSRYLSRAQHHTHVANATSDHLIVKLKIFDTQNMNEKQDTVEPGQWIKFPTDHGKVICYAYFPNDEENELVHHSADSDRSFLIEKNGDRYSLAVTVHGDIWKPE